MTFRQLHRAVSLLLASSFFLLAAGCRAKPPMTVKGKPVAYWFDELQKPDPRARKRAVFCLGLVGNKDAAALPALIRALQDRDVEVRQTAVLALLNLGPNAKEAIPALEGLRHDGDAKVREYTLKALRRIQGEPGSTPK